MTPPAYLPGMHLIATLAEPEPATLLQYFAFQRRIDLLIQQHGLCKLGEVYHNFQPGGFTGVVCLSESHVSVHTWPEYALVNIDIYLSNFSRNNDAAGSDIYKALQAFFSGRILHEHLIRR